MTGTPPQLNCPMCPRQMEFLYRTEDGTIMVYRCAIHGETQLGPDRLYAPGDVRSNEMLVRPRQAHETVECGIRPRLMTDMVTAHQQCPLYGRGNTVAEPQGDGLRRKEIAHDSESPEPESPQASRHE